MSIGNPVTLTSNIASKTITTTATQNQTVFIITGGYRINQISVFRNGVKLASDDYQARDGSTVVLTVGANAGDTLEFQIFDDFRVSSAFDANLGGAIGNSISVNGDIVATNRVGIGSTVPVFSLDAGTKTDAIRVPVGTTEQRPGVSTSGLIRYNRTLNQFEGYGNSWANIGGAVGAGTDKVFYENSINITASYTITTNCNAMTAGPIVVGSGVTVTVPSGSTWTVV